MSLRTSWTRAFHTRLSAPINQQGKFMDTNGIKRLGTKTNAIVVQLEEREYPGVVIQGDSLVNLVNLVREIRSQIEQGDLEEAADVADEVSDLLGGYLQALDDVGSD